MKHLIILISLLFPIQSLACQPCSPQYSLEETIESSDFIIIGHKISDTTSNLAADDPQHFFGPEATDIKIVELLKGDGISDIIRVRSFYAMCEYGISLYNHEDHVIFISYNEDEDEFSSVFSNCGTKTLPINDEKIAIGDNKITVDEFKQLYLNHKTP